MAEAVHSKNTRLVAKLAGLVVCMVGLAYASVPLYEIFCRVTGFGGTTQVSERASEEVHDRVITIRFDSNVNSALNWKFGPEMTQTDVQVGENTLAFYRAQNVGSEAVVGTSTFNVAPEKAGLYFAKVQCFCFT